MPVVGIHRPSCKGVEDCGLCLLVCPKELFEPSSEINESGYLPPQLVNDEQCTGCLNCQIFCPDLAIVVEDAGEGEPQ